MDRTEFMKELEYLLQDIPEEEKAEAIAYYQDYLEEAGDEHEAEAIREFGSPERIAAMIRAELNGNLEESGAFTDTGYQDERFKDPGYQVVEHRWLPEVKEVKEDKKEEEWQTKEQGNSFGRRGMFRKKEGSEGRWRRALRVVVLLALLAIAVPILGIMSKGAIGAAAGIFGVLVGLVLLVGILTVASGVLSVVLLVVGGITLFVEPWGGMVLAGCGILSLGMALLGTALSILIYGRMLPFCIRSVVDWIGGLLHRRGRRTQS